MGMACDGISRIRSNIQKPVRARASYCATLESVDGTSFNVSDYRGQVVVLDLMATWCLVCEDEMEELSQLRAERPDVVIITITVDPTETDEMLSAYKENHNADWLFARDTDNVWLKYRDLYLPTLVFIDPQGRLSFQKDALLQPFLQSS